ncbi:hypothetical protein, partial [Streptococcus macedonicus]|uniref:hypothetical protein n=1 Tax=Streptococcus macedonicus TaxID=59310 RepID=UPI001E4FFEEF
FLVMFCNSTITDLFLFVFTQLILHYLFLIAFSSIMYFAFKSKFASSSSKTTMPTTSFSIDVNIL